MLAAPGQESAFTESFLGQKRTYPPYTVKHTETLADGFMKLKVTDRANYCDGVVMYSLNNKTSTLSEFNFCGHWPNAQDMPNCMKAEMVESAQKFVKDIQDSANNTQDFAHNAQGSTNSTQSSASNTQGPVNISKQPE